MEVEVLQQVELLKKSNTEKKTNSIQKTNDASFYREFLFMTIFPLVVCTLVMMFASSYFIRSGIRNETEADLKNVSMSVLAAYDELYPGEYEARLEGTDILLYKGEQLVSGNTKLIDALKESGNLEISLFIMDTRLLTTLLDKDSGRRMTGTVANDVILQDVYSNRLERFYDNVTISGINYFAYYSPILSSDGKECIGMIGVAKSASVMDRSINQSVVTNLLIMLLGIFITSFCIVRYAGKIVRVIKLMIDYMKKLSGNNLDDRISEEVSHRKDELGEMGRMLDTLRKSLRRLIERDTLTGLYNRRSAEKKIDAIESGGLKYSVSIGDIDHFKIFNDTFGHECGDVVLKEVAAILNSNMEDGSFVARWGGEEFLMVFENRNIEETRNILLKIREDLHEREIEYNGEIHKVTMTFGAAEKQEGIPINHLIRMADDKLYEGKQGGRDRVII